MRSLTLVDQCTLNLEKLMNIYALQSSQVPLYGGPQISPLVVNNTSEHCTFGAPSDLSLMVRQSTGRCCMDRQFE